MADISLDLNKQSANYRDLLIINGDLTLTADINPVGTNPILQAILQNLSMYLGEWFLNNTLGLPWFQQILVKAPDQSKIDAIFSNSIMGTPGVLQLMQYSFAVSLTQRTLSVSFIAQTTTGKVNWSGTVSTSGQVAA